MQATVQSMREIFDGMPTTLLTLFMCVSGGINWWDLVKLFREIGDGYSLLLSIYIAIMVLALMNIVTGIFVNDAVAMAQHDHAIVQETQAAIYAEHIAQLSSVFSEADKDT